MSESACLNTPRIDSGVRNVKPFTAAEEQHLAACRHCRSAVRVVRRLTAIDAVKEQAAACAGITYTSDPAADESWFDAHLLTCPSCVQKLQEAVRATPLWE